MKILNQDEGERWLLDNGWSDDSACLPQFQYNARFTMPEKEQKIVFIAKLIISLIHDLEKDGMLWIEEWGVFPNHDDPYLFYALRKTLGEDRLLIDASHHVFDKNDLKELQCLIELTLLLLYTANLIVPSRGVVIKILGHHHYFQLQMNDRDKFNECVEAFDRMGCRTVADRH